MSEFDFPGKYYEIIRKDFRDLSAETDFFVDLAGDGGEVLDLGCGTGTNLRALHERGHTGVGVDTSVEFLSWAKSSSRGGVEYINTSITEFQCDAQFDLILCVFGTLNLIPPDKWSGLFHRMRKLLRPGGHLVVDAAQLLNYVDSYQPFVISHHEGHGVLLTRLARTIVNAHTTNWRHEETIVVREDDGRVSMYGNFFDQWLVTAGDVRRALADSGLQLTAEYGSFRRTAPPAIGKGPLIQVATRVT
ncbi:MAG: class I SAM-dependent methyltransferase [Pseudonocardiales bacterium]|nr:class I SAM-dependent methyltransferase [Pseudonocardiales bacterium]MBV9030584.1 class I SAM-dependent methyltransferase [Pseudonocardiales bacterium]MBW0010319.1 class I SAM-dependent methyltransferase [Pseudonocardiales bacterium]